MMKDVTAVASACLPWSLLLALVPVLTGCATTPPEPVVQLVEVKVAVPVPCSALADLGAEPAYADSAEALSNTNEVGALAKLYVIGRLQRIQRLAEYTAVKTSCIF